LRGAGTPVGMIGSAIGQYKRAVMLISNGLSHPPLLDASTALAYRALGRFTKDRRASTTCFLPVVSGRAVSTCDEASKMSWPRQSHSASVSSLSNELAIMM
jgi:hypothetical protein